MEVLNGRCAIKFTTTMKPYNKPSLQTIQATNKPIEVFTTLDGSENIDVSVVNDFGEEWKKFAVHTDESVKELRKEYFDIIDETIVNKNSYMIDICCGSGRWTDYFVDKAAFIEAIDPSGPRRVVQAIPKNTQGDDDSCQDPGEALDLVRNAKRLDWPAFAR